MITIQGSSYLKRGVGTYLSTTPSLEDFYSIIFFRATDSLEWEVSDAWVFIPTTMLSNISSLISKIRSDQLFIENPICCKSKSHLRLVASANSPTVIELMGELFSVELLYCNYLEILKACFKIIHYKTYLIEKCLWKIRKIVIQ